MNITNIHNNNLTNQCFNENIAKPKIITHSDKNMHAKIISTKQTYETLEAKNNRILQEQLLKSIFE